MEARPRKVALVVVRRHLGSGLLEDLAVADGAVADVGRARLDLQLRRSDRPRPRHEDLAPLRVDHGDRAGRTGGERVEGRDARSRDVERQCEPACGREADPDPREAARPDADGEARDVARVRTRLAHECVDVGEQRRGAGDPFAEQFPVADERARGAVSRGVEGQDQRHGRRLRRPRSGFAGSVRRGARAGRPRARRAARLRPPPAIRRRRRRRRNRAPGRPTPPARRP